MTTETTDDPFWVEMHKQAAAHPTEQARLERQVIEAAKKWHWLHVADRTIAPAAQEASYSTAADSLSVLVDALLSFEANQK